MNETNFANYENYFGGTNLQVSIDNSLLQNMDFDMPPTAVHSYMTNNVSCDLPLSSTSVDQRLGPNTCYPFLAQKRNDHDPKLKEVGTNLCVTTSSSMASTNSAGIFASIPFVQIHTTDVQPQKTSYGNVFRRNISKQEEIKSEPIKSESADASKDRTNATPTPPRAPSSTQTPTEGELQLLEHDSNVQCQNEETNKIEKSRNQFQIYKCSKCPFLALKEEERDNHFSKQHVNKTVHESPVRQPVTCPGCDNIFFNSQSFEIHLRLDHLMSQEDTLKVLNSSTILKEKETPKEIIATEDTSFKEPLRKSRIYLKNVDCLREPNRLPFEQTENQLTEHNNNNNNNNNNNPIVPANKSEQPTKQKISIKSVDVLREPALLRRDYELDQGNFNNFINSNQNLNEQMSMNVPTTYDYSQNSDTIIANNCNINSNNLESVHSTVNTSSEVVQKQRRPKIYVKSVESFNLMPLDSIRTAASRDFLEDHNNMCNVAPSQVYDTNVSHMPFMYESNSGSNSITSNGNYINNHNELDSAYQYINNSTQMNNNYIMDTSLYTNVHVDDLNINSEQLVNENFVVNETPPPPQNLLINADENIVMNKSPHPIHEQRGTLHLRTVDELNLMNKNEVQHLIAPQLDNNHGGEVTPKNDQALDINNVDFISGTLYETDSFKFQDLDTQMVNGWPDTYEDLEEDINGILTEVTTGNNAENNVQKNSYNNNSEIDTPQVSMITIRDIDELTGVATSVPITDYDHGENNQDISSENLHISRETIDSDERVCITQNINLNGVNSMESDSENLKRELSNSTPETREPPVLSTNFNSPENPQRRTSLVDSIPLPPTSELPPLVPVTISLPTGNTSQNATDPDVIPNPNIPVPSLVPVPPLIKINKAIAKPPPTSSPVEKGRIYVANNLMEPTKRPVAVAATCGTSVRGRPYGSNRTRITQLKQIHGNSAEEFFVKCTIKGCAFRFKQTETLEYHKKCHDATSNNSQATVCPECKSTEFNNWNTLHTHLWRAHQIDMELYKCELCDFKTPIFSRLVNTHAKIHFDDRNYKCEQCGKGFKNSKQLKNHRRWHRVQSANAAKPKETPTEIHQCPECGSTFSQQKSLREHCCKKSDSSLKCDICQKAMSTKASLKMHLLTHSNGEKRYKCQQCDYATNDHNAFRRHRMTHENKKMYECQFCEYKSVQSVAYQKHVQQKHPDKADSVIHKCSECTFSTINPSLLLFHQAKHKPKSAGESNTSNRADENSTVDKSTINDVQKSKIKVKSNLFTTTSE